MNPESGEQFPPPPQPQPHLKATSCPRHPDEQFTGFCPSCLCERLAVLDKSSSSSTSSSITAGRKSASSAIKSLFKGTASTTTNVDNNAGSLVRGRPSSSSFLPELRRTKSFSGGKNEGGLLGVSTGAFEPQRKSCDVRGRSTLFALFSQDDVKRNVVNEGSTSSAAAVAPELKGEVVDHVVEEVEEEEEEFHDSNDNGDEIQVVEEEFPQSSSNHTTSANNINNSSCLVDDFSNNNDDDKVGNCSGEQKLEGGQKVELKPMKDHIDLDSQNKKVGSKDLKELAGSFWSAASVFSKKLRAWTKKNNSNHQKMKKGSHTVQVNGKKGNAGRNCRDTQSEIADYGFGRRSCDTDPRFSLDAGRFSVDAAMAGRFSVDAGRMSFDDVRCSFEEPRASWDGYLIGGRPFPRMMPPMVSVVEDAPAAVPAPVPVPAPAPVMVSRKDAQIPVEEPRRSSVSINGDDPMPGNAAQTKDYYSDSSSKKRRSLDRSSSIRKTAAAVVAEMDEMKSNECCNAKITTTHAADVDYLQGTKVVASGGDRDFRGFDLLNSHSHSHSHSHSYHSHSHSHSLRDDYSGSFDMGYSRDNVSVLGSHHCDNKGSKKSRRWRAWNIWGLLYRRGNTKDVDVDVDDDDRYSRSNGVERSYSESWNGDPRAGFSRNMLRSNSSVSWRNSFNNTMGGPLGGSIRKGSGGGGGTIDSNTNGRKKKEEFVLERNRSARYSPGHADNGMLRFYLTPMRGSRRGGNSVKPKPAYSHSFARSVLRLY